MVCFTLSAVFHYLPLCPLLLLAHKTPAEGKKKHQEFLAKLKKGDRVITSSGIVGTVVEVGEDTVSLKVDANTRITFLKEHIAGYHREKEEEKS